MKTTISDLENWVNKFPDTMELKFKANGQFVTLKRGCLERSMSLVQGDLKPVEERLILEFE